METKFSGKKVEDFISPKLDDLIECFVEYFGEEYREQITSKVKSAKMFFVPKAEPLAIGGIKMSYSIENYYDKKIDKKLKTLPNVIKTAKDYEKLQQIALLAKTRDHDVSATKKIFSPLIQARTQYKNAEILAFADVISTYDSSKHLSVERTYELVETWRQLVTKNFLSMPSYQERLEKEIELFNILGFKHENAKDYYNDEKLSAIIFEVADFIKTELTEENRLKYMTKYLGSNPYFENLRKQVTKTENEQFVQRILYSAYLSMTDNAEGASCLFLCDKQNKLNSFMFFPEQFDTSTSLIIHEFVHVISASLMDKTPKGLPYGVKVGVRTLFHMPFDDGKYSKTNFIKKLNSDDFELSGYMYNNMLNEIITDYFAMQITKIATKRNLKIGLQQNNPSAYSYAFPFFENFIENNKKTIIDCFFDNSLDKLTASVGTKNFNNLAELAKKFLDLSYYITNCGLMNEILTKSNNNDEKIDKILEKYNSLDMSKKEIFAINYNGPLHNKIIANEIQALRQYKSYYKKDIDWSSSILQWFGIMEQIEYHSKACEMHKRMLKIKQQLKENADVPQF